MHWRGGRYLHILEVFIAHQIILCFQIFISCSFQNLNSKRKKIKINRRKHEKLIGNCCVRFECLVLALTLLTNMVENSVENRQSIMDSMASQKDAGLSVKV
jgi:hypothetical protein